MGSPRRRSAPDASPGSFRQPATANSSTCACYNSREQIGFSLGMRRRIGKERKPVTICECVCRLFESRRRESLANVSMPLTLRTAVSSRAWAPNLGGGDRARPDRARKWAWLDDHRRGHRGRRAAPNPLEARMRTGAGLSIQPCRSRVRHTPPH